MTDANPGGDEGGIQTGGQATEEGVSPGTGTGGRNTGLVAATKMGDVDPEALTQTSAGPGGPAEAAGDDASTSDL